MGAGAQPALAHHLPHELHIYCFEDVFALGLFFFYCLVVKGHYTILNFGNLNERRRILHGSTDPPAFLGLILFRGTLDPGCRCAENNPGIQKKNNTTHSLYWKSTCIIWRYREWRMYIHSRGTFYGLSCCLWIGKRLFEIEKLLFFRK